MISNYYLNSFFWSTFSKVLNAILGFISIPLLLGFYGKADYGILSIATACNGYMHLLDLGMNTGAVRFYSQWRASGQLELIEKVAHTNITFYILIACINALGLVALSIWGGGFFSITNEQFSQLRICLLILAFFSIFSWVTTAFNQLLIADKKIAFTMQVYCVQTVMKMLLIILVFCAKLSMTQYFFLFSFILSLAIVPISYWCVKNKLIDNVKPAFHWKEFSTVLNFSLSIFALSLFQMTATQSRSILLGVFSSDGAGTVAEFKILEVIPTFVIMIGGSFSAIFLPKSSSMVSSRKQKEIERFAYKWTTLTTILSNLLCVPFIWCAKEVLTVYVGPEYSGLSFWLVLWLLTVIVQIHTTPGNSLVLAYGKTKLLVITTAISCVISIILNIMLCDKLGIGSAVTGYFIYVIIVVGLYYVIYYNKLLHLKRLNMILCFVRPTLLAFCVLGLVSFIPVDLWFLDGNTSKMTYLGVIMLKTLLWMIPYVALLFVFKIVKLNDLRKE